MIKEKISIIIPCFNEEKTISKNIRTIYEYIKESYRFFEIIVSNDGSTDNTRFELEKIKKEIPIKIISTPKNEGKGAAIKKGVFACDNESDVIMFLDADLAIPIFELEKFHTALKKQNLDIVIASRFVPGVKVLEPVLQYRKIMEIIFRFLRAIILNDWKIRDSQCGFKIFKSSTAKKIFQLTTISRFAFDSEVIYLAKKMNSSIKELPITLCNSKESHIRILIDPVNMFFSLFKIRLNDLQGLYKINTKNIKNEVVISVDDFGESFEKNSKILKLVKKDRIDRVAVMIERNLSKEEIAFLKQSGVKIDLHLETFERQEVESQSGAFQRGINFGIDYFFQKKYASSEIEKMWDGQIRHFEKIFGQKPDGLNSHEHVHLFPYFFQIACLLAEKHEITYIRLGKKGCPFVHKIVRHILHLFHFKNKKILHNFKNIRSSEYLLSLDWILNKNNPEKYLKPKTEIVCHPKRKKEYAFLENISA
ncbi:MAG: Glycosyl transferase family protein [Parcubacteria group bacterium Athens0714_25]|nr:MAG: Glycosyl transferase family protein [Parcubacteria group bacterium Athens0714_25]